MMKCNACGSFNIAVDISPAAAANHVADDHNMVVRAALHLVASEKTDEWRAGYVAGCKDSESKAALRPTPPAPSAQSREPVAQQPVAYRCPDCAGTGVYAKALILPEPPDVTCSHCNGRGTLYAAPQAPSVPAVDSLLDALESIRRYGLDTLSGRDDGGIDDREWQRESVNEMTKRARIAIEKIRSHGDE